jgi:putative methyltransferase (TIGR04325 family)
MNCKNRIVPFTRAVMPPFLWDYACRVSSALFRNQIRFIGNYKSWEEAEAASSGYHAEAILENTMTAVRKVKSGEMAFERDGVAFQEMEYNFPLGWALMRAAARKGRLHVLDFGGALGSTYFQSCALIKSIPHLKWTIVEQPAHVEAGAKEFATEELSFHRKIEDACQSEQFNVLLLSGIIQYLPNPLGFLDSVLERRISSVVVDRTPFMTNGATRLTVQNVPNWIYSASYPAWFFSENELLAKFARHYDKIATWPALDKHNPEGGRAEYKGFLFELRGSTTTNTPP